MRALAVVIALVDVALLTYGYGWQLVLVLALVGAAVIGAAYPVSRRAETLAEALVVACVALVVYGALIVAISAATADERGAAVTLKWCVSLAIDQSDCVKDFHNGAFDGVVPRRRFVRLVAVSVRGRRASVRFEVRSEGRARRVTLATVRTGRGWRVPVSAPQ